MNNLKFEYNSNDAFDESLESEIAELNEDLDNQEELNLSDYSDMGYDDEQFKQLNSVNETINEDKKPRVDKTNEYRQLLRNPNVGTGDYQLNSSYLNILSQDAGNTAFGFSEDDSKELIYIKNLLNNFIKKLPSFNEDEWKGIAESLDSNKSLGKSIPIKIYKIASVKFLISYAMTLNLLLSKDGPSLRVYDSSSWYEAEENFVKVFISMACVKLGVPKWQALDEKFSKDLFTQLSNNGFFKKMSYPDDTLINLQNGTLSIGLDGITLSSFNPNHYQTYKLNFSYDPKAINNEWINFINDVLPDKDTQRTLQQSLGYLFIQRLKLEKMIFLFGEGSNGKSVINEVMNALFGDDLITHYSLETLTNPKSYQRASIANKLINYCSDINLNKIDFAEMKILASGEKIQVRQIYQAPYIMTRYPKFIFNINKIDDVNVESTIGFFRRMLFVPFEKTILEKDQDKFLPHRILMNKAGVLNWILEGTRQVLQNQEIFMSQRCYDFLDNFKKESNLAARFIEDTKLVPSVDNIIDFQTMYDSFVNFCKKQGEPTLKQKLFNKELKKQKIPFDRKNFGMVWCARFLK